MTAMYAQERASAQEPQPTTLRFDPRKAGLARWLGSLEETIMLLMWQSSSERTVKGVWKDMQRNGSTLAYTTVMTTMTRLWDKGMLARTKRGLSYSYRIRESREQFEERQIAAVLASLEETA
jgi:predicted transcriptional regulator